MAQVHSILIQKHKRTNYRYCASHHHFPPVHETGSIHSKSGRAMQKPNKTKHKHGFVHWLIHNNLFYYVYIFMYVYIIGFDWCSLLHVWVRMFYSLYLPLCSINIHVHKICTIILFLLQREIGQLKNETNESIL